MTLKNRATFFAAAALLAAALATPAFAVIRDGGIDPANLGKGDWIFSMKDATNRLASHVAAVTNENSLMLYYKSQGIRWIAVKSATGTNFYQGCQGHPQFTSNLVNIARSNNILIFGYNRSYATNVAGEIAMADYVFNQGADGFIWDAEVEWETASVGSQGPALALAQLGVVRTNWPNKFLAHSPFPIISVHTSFPYKEFGYWCDAAMPQIYHFNPAFSIGFTQSVSQAISWTDANWGYYQDLWSNTAPSVINGATFYWSNSIKPIIPIQDVYGTGSATICEGTASAKLPKDVMEFIDGLQADRTSPSPGGYQGAVFFRTDLRDPNQWAYVQAGTLGNFTGIVNNIVLDDTTTSYNPAAPAWPSVRTFSNSIPVPNKTFFFGNGTLKDTNSFGTNYLMVSQGSGARWAQYNPPVVVAGDYNVYQWHPSITNASAAVPHIVTYNGGTATINANQQTNDGNWSLLGRFPFASGTSGSVRVTDAFPESSAVGIADGLKMVFVPPASAPQAPNNLQAIGVTTNQINLTWNDNATNEATYVVTASATAGGPYTEVAWLPPNATAFTHTNLPAGVSNYYVVRATNWLGSASTAQAGAATLSATVPPGITTQPQNVTTNYGASATFTVTATGSTPLYYQWRFNAADITGATNSSYTRTNLHSTDAGPYSVLVSNAANTILSSNAQLVVLPPPAPAIGAISSQPGGQIQFQVTGSPGQYAVDGTTNFVDWVQLTNFTTTGTNFIFTDSTATLSRRFYHVRLIW